MALKKQTVWLLTMLSLIIVLSVYYVTSGTTDFALPTDDEQEEGVSSEVEVEVTQDGEAPEGSLEVNGQSVAESFAEIRINKEVSRSQQAEQYGEIISSSDATPEEQVEARDKSMEILNITQSEEQLEALVKAKGYDNVLVISEDSKVQILVDKEELSSAEANDIILLAKEQLGTSNNVSVSHNPGSN
ncbi:SpoIIIAH-like family protein [Alkalicoccobacillus porphyridii]|uniref:SpoIIIAH-like family protein n=1 Tax=Alkalicoccobacillus porphyridii TaxID=2597270 RepID=A0A553ZVD6_9BACI|nr:SpoIIIAH-like family protein [Alkalicoccobacillus porphyridii]TSB45392.1 SpoIIIAH-like family protein [Alkalicoccobacillus porphyridii]